MPVSAWSIPRAERSTVPRGNSLGPGEYNAQRLHRQQPPSYSVPRAAPKNKTNGVPGPGNYPEADQNWSKAKTAAPQFTMRPKTATKVENDNPGPIYDPKPIGLKNAPNYTMRPKTAIDKKPDTPGPGNYQPTVDSSKPVIIANVRFGKEERRGLADRKQTPGPGNYDVSFKDVPGPKYHMGLKTDPIVDKTAVPGPGSYPLKTLFEVNVEKEKGNSLVPRRPASAAAAQAPGPGAYEADPKAIKQRAPKFAFGKSQRDGMDKEARRVPGPGNYEINPIVDLSRSNCVSKI